jgi:hypothetical protein
VGARKLPNLENAVPDGTLITPENIVLDGVPCHRVTAVNFLVQSSSDSRFVNL